MELVWGFSSGRAGRKIRLLFVNSLAKSFSASRAPCTTDISWLVTGLVTVNGNRMRVDDLASFMIRRVKDRPGALSVCVGEQRDEQYDNRECDQEDVNDPSVMAIIAKHANPVLAQGLTFSSPFCIHGKWIVQKI